MIGSFIKPRNTFISVANEIGKGLEDETVYLNDNDLIEAGYKIHELEGVLYSLAVPLVSLSFAIIYLISLASIFFIGEKYKTIPALFILINLAAMLRLILYRVHRIKKRLITKKSSRSR